MPACTKCHEVKEADEFYQRRTGERAGQRMSWCKVCQRRNSKRHSATRYERFKEILAAAKDVPCARCGERYPPHVMDFHHRDSAQKEVNIGTYDWGAGERLRAEIAKCDVLCANCHRIVEHELRLAVA